jgi:hypothetical protein
LPLREEVRQRCCVHCSLEEKNQVFDDLTDYLSFEIVFSNDKKKAWLGQPHLIKNLREYKTPGTPNLNMIRCTDPKLTISKLNQKLYHSGTGMLLYLVKHSRPDISNPVRELSKVLRLWEKSCAIHFKSKRISIFVLSARISLSTGSQISLFSQIRLFFT